MTGNKGNQGITTWTDIVNDAVEDTVNDELSISASNKVTAKSTARNYWRSNYSKFVEANVFDMEALTNLTNEVKNETMRHDFFTTQIKAAPFEANYLTCNKTGQTLGIAASSRLGSSIAPQWLNTGTKHLKKNADSQPIAYTVYLLSLILNAAQKSAVERGYFKEGTETLQLMQASNFLKFATSRCLCYSNNSSALASTLTRINIMQTGMIIVEKLIQARPTTDGKIVIKKFIALLSASIEQLNKANNMCEATMQKLFQQLGTILIDTIAGIADDLRPSNSVTLQRESSFEACEDAIAKAIIKLDSEIAGKSKDNNNNVINSSAFSNVLPSSKPKTRTASNAYAKQMVAKKVASELDIFS